jgi:pyruvate dehydrogenase kinase 2/3/4
MLVSRISRRVLAEHHIALSKDYNFRREGAAPHADHVGVIHTGLNIRESIERCTNYLRDRAFDIDHDLPSLSNTSAEWSEVIVDGHTETRFPYIKEHLECV